LYDTIIIIKIISNGTLKECLDIYFRKIYLIHMYVLYILKYTAHYINHYKNTFIYIYVYVRNFVYAGSDSKLLDRHKIFCRLFTIFLLQ